MRRRGADPMTRLLVSVRDVPEAHLALAAGVDLIDVKEPHAGPLGGAAPETIAAIVRGVARRVPTSAACGELLEFAPAAAVAPVGVDYAKLGLAGCAHHRDWPARWQTAWQAFPASCGRIAVVYADARRAQSPAPEEIIDRAIEAACAGVLFDTFGKDAGDLFDALSLARLESLLRAIRAAGLLVVLAGSLRGASLRAACQLAPDYVGVRGAACRGARHGQLDADLLAALVAELPPRAAQGSALHR